MDNIQKLIEEIKGDRSIMNVYYTSNFLNNVGDFFEKYGFGATKLFLLDKQSRRELKDQATALVRVLAKLEEYNEVKTNRAIGRLIFKTLLSLKANL